MHIISRESVVAQYVHTVITEALSVYTFHASGDRVKTGDRGCGGVGEAPENVVLWVDAQSSARQILLVVSVIPGERGRGGS